MNTRERFIRTLTGQEVDRVPYMKIFGGTDAVLPRWEQERPGIADVIDTELGFEGVYRGWQITPVNFGLCGRPEPEETKGADGQTIFTYPDGQVNIALPDGDFHGMTVAWPVKDRDSWEKLKAYLDPDDPRRFPDNWSSYVAEFNTRDYPLQLTHGGVYGFARNIVGDEHLAYMFYDDPELVHDIMDTYTTVQIKIWEKLVAEAEFDLVEFWEDMASKNGSIISPAAFREFMKPNYLRVREFCQEHNVPIMLVDSDGFTEKLAENLVECGVNAMYPFEVLAGNDVARGRAAHPTLAAIGGLDKNVMAHGKEAIDKEMEKARELIRGGRFIPGPDHFALSDTPYEGYKYFMQQMREVVMTTKPGD